MEVTERIHQGQVIPIMRPQRELSEANGRRFKHDGDPAFTLTTRDIHGVYDGSVCRLLTPLECERLQGFPDNWTKGIPESQRYKTLGNAVTVPVIEYIVRHFEV
jgi:DNA (cytosine-5)-methyltransferase 1